MKILFLFGNENAKELIDWLFQQGDTVISTFEKIDQSFIKEKKIDLIISYTYRYIIKKEILEAVNYNAINLHISYLPWNRGANPNQWSFIDDTPKGVTIHYIDSKIDSGDIISQKLVQIKDTDTLKSSYAILSFEIVNLFKQIYPLYPYWVEMRKKAVGKGTCHSIGDFQLFDALLNGDYNISVLEFSKKAREMRMNQHDDYF